MEGEGAVLGRGEGSLFFNHITHSLGSIDSVIMYLHKNVKCLIKRSCLYHNTSIMWFGLLCRLFDDHLYSAILRSLEQTHCGST